MDVVAEAEVVGSADSVVECDCGLDACVGGYEECGVVLVFTASSCVRDVFSDEDRGVLVVLS